MAAPAMQLAPMPQPLEQQDTSVMCQQPACCQVSCILCLEFRGAVGIVCAPARHFQRGSWPHDCCLSASCMRLSLLLPSQVAGGIAGGIAGGSRKRRCGSPLDVLQSPAALLELDSSRHSGDAECFHLDLGGLLQEASPESQQLSLRPHTPGNAGLGVLLLPLPDCCNALLQTS